MSSEPSPLPQRAQYGAQAPLSPPSPTSSAAAAAATNSAVSKRPLVQTNLPSSPAPSHSSVDGPPNVDALNISGPTPPASVPMSAQQSQTSIADTPLYSPPANHNVTSDPMQLDQPKGVFENQLRNVSGSKRKMEDDENATPSKRARTEEPTPNEEPQVASSSLEEDNSSLEPLFKLRSQRKNPLSSFPPLAFINRALILRILIDFLSLQRFPSRNRTVPRIFWICTI